ncbi:hypothetical protein KC363_g7599 [Hortaea werneckii]|nr:hypothetical protein KC361_g8943 [Hortaea werneckii]KAI7184672.1 hypothetical protein KC363_g7599 [Hortaea werneckii]
MDPSAPNNITPQEYQQFLQWRQQQQQRQQAPPPPPPPPPQQDAASQSQYAPMVTFMESRFEHNLNQMIQNLPQYSGGPSQVQQPQFNQPQLFAAPQCVGVPFGTQQPQYNQPQGFVAPQSTAPAAAAPQQWFAGLEARRPFAPQFMPPERGPSAFEARGTPSQDGWTPTRDQSFSIGMDNGPSETTWTPPSGSPRIVNWSPCRSQGTYVQPSVEDEIEEEEV